MKFAHHSISINTLCLILLVLVFGAMGLSGASLRDVNIHLRDQSRIEQERRQSATESQTLADTSDYLTSEAWRFAATQNPRHLSNYWDEVDTRRNRDRAVANLAGLPLTRAEQDLIDRAKAESDALIAREARAMRLIADSMGMRAEDMPGAVARAPLTPEEEALPPEKKLETATLYLFGERYRDSKRVIMDNARAFRAQFSARKADELVAAEKKTRSALAMTLAYNLTALFLLLLTLLSLYLLVARPFRRYAHALHRLKEDDPAPLRPGGARETRAFAQDFNRMFGDWIQQKRRLQAEQFRFHVAIENMAVVVYEYDVPTDVYTAYGSLDARPDNRLTRERIAPDFLRDHMRDIVEPKAREHIEALLRGQEVDEVEMRLRMLGGREWIWGRVSGTPIRDESGQVVRIIGKITNIQAEKEREFALEEARSRDALTGLNNKEAGIRKVRDYMATKSPDEVCGMMLLDMDDFARLNGEEGHVYADAVLREVADILRAETGPDDILTRLGGDEFMLFIKNCPKSRATILGPGIAARISALSRGDNPDLRISASIGMCVTAVVDEYSGLYRCAESTLKYVKEHGKGSAACYLDTSNELGTMLVQVYAEKHRINAIDRPGEHEPENLISFGLELLGKSRRLDDALFLLLARLGRSCGLDRVSIVDIDPEYLCYRFPYQWARDPADLAIGSIGYLSAEQADKLGNSYDEDGLSEQVPPIATAMPACLHAAIWNQGRCVGALSFEVCREGHVWSPDQRKLLAEMTKLVASFILKARADEISKAKSDFLSRMSHEIRTPMNAITGMTAIAKTVLDDKNKTLECLEKIESANTYLLGLINDILDMSRIESGKVELNLESADLGEETRKIESLMRPQAEAKPLRFTVENAFTGPRVMVDVLRLHQVLVNIVGNAIKFTPAGGDVTVRLEPLPGDGADASRLRFAVTDTGIGITPEARSRIFTAFEQGSKHTTAAYGGTGLGLAISSRLVQMMGGSLEVDSRPGQGSTFFFELTVLHAPATKTPTSNPAPAADGDFDVTGRRVLVAEDNLLNREIAETLLTMRGFTVESAENGRQALDMFAASAPGYYDAILMDIRMPVMDGLEATRLIRTLGRPDSRGVPIIAMTANAFDEDMKQSLASGMSDHLSKPIDVDHLMEVLQSCLDGATVESGTPPARAERTGA